MTTIYGLLGSPRKNGNTATLLDQLFKGAAEAGATSTSLSANTLQIHGCQGCMLCKSSGVCAVKDGMEEIYANIDDADVVVFASPIYFGTITAQLITVLHRLYAYLRTDFTCRLAPGKTAVLLLTQGNPQADAFAGYAEILSGMLKRIGFAQVEILLAPGLRDRAAASKEPALLASAYALGKRLASTDRPVVID